MKLDPTVMRTMHSKDFQVLEAVEKGMKDHALVPLALVTATANLRNGGTHKIMATLLRDKLLSHETKRNAYDGYRITNAGYDILALHHLKSRGVIAAMGQRVGTGKESDIYIAADPQGRQIILKIHRLGRTSFRNVKKKRDYFGKATQQAHSWLFLSRLSALKEYAFMKALHNVQYPTPTPLAHNRHIVAMSLVRGMPLYQIMPKQVSVEQAADIYQQALELASRLAQHGLVHCDLNEFNLLVDLSGIQAMATSDNDDPYVRHSGQSVAPEKSMGLLSKPAWEQSLEEEDHMVLPEPIQRLENGEPKPVVTLIDFPQMISVKHPNAQELYEHDMACLRRFFELKLRCTVPDDIGIDVTWESVTSTSLAAVDEKRLDEELRASGVSDTMNRDLELYYFESGPRAVQTAIIEDDENDDDDEESYSEEDANSIIQSGSIVDDQQDQSSVESAQNLLNDNDLNDDQVGDNLSEGKLSIDAASEIVVTKNLVDIAQLEQMTRAQLEEIAKARIRKQLEDEKRKSRKKKAFRPGNSNKSYVKGKRVLKDSLF